MKLKLTILFLLAAVLTTTLLFQKSYACSIGQQACSSSYGVSRTDFSSGSGLDTTCGTQFCAAQTLGDLTVGNTKGTNYQAQEGYNVNRSPSLEFIINTTNINVGVLSTASTTTATATFEIQSYLSSGYAVETLSPPPQNGTYTIAAPTTPTASAVGTEQFGINLVGNYISSGIVSTSCGTVNLGSNPIQLPSSSFSYGAAATNYNTCGKFMYKNGDIIATSNQSSGETEYTITYIFNISSITPAGLFTMNQQLVAVPTF